MNVYLRLTTLNEYLYRCLVLLISLSWKFNLSRAFWSLWARIVCWLSAIKQRLHPKYIGVTIIFISYNVDEDVWEKLSVVDDVWNLCRPCKLNKESRSQLFNKKYTTNHIRSTLYHVYQTNQKYYFWSILSPYVYIFNSVINIVIDSASMNSNQSARD